ncbi:MAG: hypothetical protein H6581_21930 [Bacteroidia bacterium]|nr:hypothetical protein [Bacteroidia bacterium]
MKVIKITALFLLLLFGATGKFFAKEINIKEVKISLFNKPVVGYRLFLDKPNKTVINQILKHVGKYDHKPFLFERTVIFENIFYPPVTERKEISLYYLLHDLPGGFSEMTVVGMYDYKRSINTEEFPDLALMFLADIAKLVNRISGDVIRFEDLLLDDEMLGEMNDRLVEEAISDSNIEFFQEEEVENNSIRIKNDPFSNDETDEGTMAQKLALRIAELDEKEKRLLFMEEKFNLAEQELEIKRKSVEKTAQQNEMLRDSIKLLNHRLGKLVMTELAGDETSVSAEDHEAITLMEDQLIDKQTEVFKVTALLDSMQRKLQAQETRLKLAEIDNQQLLADLKQMRVANSDLKAEYMEFKSKVYATTGADGNPDQEGFAQASNLKLEAENKYLNDSLKTLNKRIGKLEKNLSKVSEQAALLENAKPDTVYINVPDTSQAKQVTTVASDQQTREEMLALRAEINELKDKNSGLVSEKKELQSRLDASFSTQKNLEETSKKLLAKVEKSQKDIAAQKAENESIATSQRQVLQKLDRSRDSVQTYVKANTALKKKVSELENAGKPDPVVIDSLNRKIRAQNNEKKELAMKITRLRYRVDSLSNLSLPAGEQEAFLREQRQELAQLNNELQAKEKEIRDKNKLLDQRESNFETRKKDIESREEKLKILKDYENQLKLLEQRIRQQGAGEVVDQLRKETVGVDPAQARFVGPGEEPILREEIEDGKTIYAFNYTLPMGYRSAERQIAAFMLYNGFMYDEKFPDLEYNSVQVAKIHERPLEIKFRLKSDGTDTNIRATFKIKGGAYLEPEENLQGYLQAKDFMRNLSRFVP